ncbi:MAG: DUF2075 domain-containing protein [Opitutaceae bacterium]|jgi:hypothetical protein|nr:DUF2075 domain-containing protein [Opitutaceae bacterium]
MSSAAKNLANETCGWASAFPVFKAARLEDVVNALTAFVQDATPEQIRAWKSSVPPLQEACGAASQFDATAVEYGALLEYKMPDGPHRVDAVLLVSGAVLVLELKGDGNWQPSYVEQAADYARRLYWYHSLCGEDQVRVHTLLVSYGQKGDEIEAEFHTRTNVENLLNVIRRFDQPGKRKPIPVAKFIEPTLCQPSVSLVQAARRFFSEHELPHIKRIDDITTAAVSRVTSEIHSACEKKGRKLILLSGVPGAGKTFVGLKIAHEAFLDDLAVPLANGEKPTAPAVFLSGNKPLVEVLQYELRKAGGEGRVFVRGVKDFVAKYSKPRSPVPPHHVLIFDEAQRAWDAARVQAKHKDAKAVSEPEAFVRFASRIPDWSVVMGLIGEGQEIHTGEEGGMNLWAEAIERSGPGWEVVGPARYGALFSSRGISYAATDDLHLAKSVRFNFASGLSEWAAKLVEDSLSTDAQSLALLAGELRAQGYQIRITRDLDKAKTFLWEKYDKLPDARFGLMISSRDRDLEDLGIEEPAFIRTGPWYADPQASVNSCRRLMDPVTEFAAQGLELDHTLLVWGGDFLRQQGKWDLSRSKKYQRGGVKDPMQLRRNAYRVLLTRGREGLLICVHQQLAGADETFDFLVAAGCEVLA